MSWEDRASLGLFISFQLAKVLHKGETDAAELAGMMVGKSDKTIREWTAQLLDTNDLPKSKQGHYQRTGVLHLNTVASQYIRANASVKGKACRFL